MENRRTNKRFNLKQMVEIGLYNEENFVNVESVDLSIGGLQCILNEPLVTNSDLYIMFEVSINNKTQVIKTYGKLAWQEKKENHYNAGINFKYLNKQDKEVLSLYIDSLNN
ncbi:MAG: PilZ domain-containing protein [Spirochaetales bacterium]|nr:PilZ domain-containing protein [Spirochaetales bacterium]